MKRQTNYTLVVLLGFGTLSIRESLCHPTPDDFLSQYGLNYFSKTAKSVPPKFGFNRLLSPISDLQNRFYNLFNERNNVEFVHKSLHPWQITGYNVEKPKDNHGKQYKFNEEPINTQRRTEHNNETISPVTPNNTPVSISTTTETLLNYDINKARDDSNDEYATETTVSPESTTEFTTDTTETTTELEELTDRIALPAPVVATLLG